MTLAAISSFLYLIEQCGNNKALRHSKKWLCLWDSKCVSTCVRACACECVHVCVCVWEREREREREREMTESDLAQMKRIHRVTVFTFRCPAQKPLFLRTPPRTNSIEVE